MWTDGRVIVDGAVRANHGSDQRQRRCNARKRSNHGQDKGPQSQPLNCRYGTQPTVDEFGSTKSPSHLFIPYYRARRQEKIEKKCGKVWVVFRLRACVRSRSVVAW